MRTITKKELVHRIAQSTGQTKVVVKDVIQAFLDATIDELARGNRLEFREFGVFETKERAARRAQNPRTLEKVEVPAKRTVKFKPGRLMRTQVSDAPAGDPSSNGAMGREPADAGEDPSDAVLARGDSAGGAVEPERRGAPGHRSSESGSPGAGSPDHAATDSDDDHPGR